MLTKLKANSIQASGLSRIVKHISESAVGTISAFRQFRAEAYTLFRDEILKCEETKTSKREIKGILPYQIHKSENMQRHKLMGFELSKFTRKYKGGYISIQGQYTETGETKPSKEASYIVWVAPQYEGQLKQFLIELGQKYEQDSITFAKHGEPFSLISTAPDKTNIYNTPVGSVILKFKGARYGSLSVIDPTDPSEQYRLGDKNITVFKKQVQDVFSRVKGRPFYWTTFGQDDWDEFQKMSDDKNNVVITKATQPRGSGQGMAYYNSVIQKGVPTVYAKLEILPELLDTDKGLQQAITSNLYGLDSTGICSKRIIESIID